MMLTGVSNNSKTPVCSGVDQFVQASRDKQNEESKETSDIKIGANDFKAGRQAETTTTKS